MNPAFERHLENNKFVARWEKAQTSDEKCALCEEFLKKHGKQPVEEEWKKEAEAWWEPPPKLPPIQPYVISPHLLPPLPPKPLASPLPPPPVQIETIRMSTRIPHYYYHQDFAFNCERMMKQDILQQLSEFLVTNRLIEFHTEHIMTEDTMEMRARLRVLKP